MEEKKVNEKKEPQPTSETEPTVTMKMPEFGNYFHPDATRLKNARKAAEKDGKRITFSPDRLERKYQEANMARGAAVAEDHVVKHRDDLRVIDFTKEPGADPEKAETEWVKLCWCYPELLKEDVREKMEDKGYTLGIRHDLPLREFRRMETLLRKALILVHDNMSGPRRVDDGWRPQYPGEGPATGPTANDSRRPPPPPPKGAT